MAGTENRNKADKQLWEVFEPMIRMTSGFIRRYTAHKPVMGIRPDVARTDGSAQFLDIPNISVRDAVEAYRKDY